MASRNHRQVAVDATTTAAATATCQAGCGRRFDCIWQEIAVSSVWIGASVRYLSKRFMCDCVWMCVDVLLNVHYKGILKNARTHSHQFKRRNLLATLALSVISPPPFLVTYSTLIHWLLHCHCLPIFCVYRHHTFPCGSVTIVPQNAKTDYTQ